MLFDHCIVVDVEKQIYIFQSHEALLQMFFLRYTDIFSRAHQFSNDYYDY